jgi:hypothetical protein
MAMETDGNGGTTNITNNMTVYRKNQVHTYKRWKDTDSDVFFIPDLYFSGCDTSIYINTRHIVDVSNIFFSLRQNSASKEDYYSELAKKIAQGGRRYFRFVPNDSCDWCVRKA